MGTPYVGEIRMFGGNFAPSGWALCDGSLVSISENETLFNLIGTTYGGDGQETFALPDLRGRVPVHQGTGPGLSTRVIGELSGTETVTLSTQQIPSHTHPLIGTTGAGGQVSPSGNLLATSSVLSLYASETASSAMAPTNVTPSGGNQPHENMQPYLCVTFIISLFGVFPSQT